MVFNIAWSLDGRLSNLESRRYGRYLIYFFLLIFYGLVHAPRVFVLNNFATAVFPLNALYIADNLFFSGGTLNHALATTVISPSNLVLDYPPGIYLLSYIAGSVKNIFLISLIVQSIVPVLFYRFYRSVSSPSMSLLASILSTFYFLDTSWWSPDFFIQPLIIIGCFILFSLIEKPDSREWHKMLYIGFITGVVISLKHNTGIFWGILCIAWLILRHISFAPEGRSPRQRPMLLVSVGCFFLFGFVFLSRQVHADAVIYYLAPHFTFWGLVAYYVFKDKSVDFDGYSFFRNAFILSFASVVLPIIVFLWVGSAVGYSRYWSSFGMGLEYQRIWDHGIAGVIGHYYSKFESFSSFKSIYINYTTFVHLLMFLVPFAVSSLIVYRLFGLVKKADGERLRKQLPYLGTGIMATFMLFPLEAIHILETKLFIFVYLFLYLAKEYRLNLRPWLKAVFATIFLLPVFLFAAAKPLVALKAETSHGSGPVRAVMGLSMEKPIAEELERQVEAVRRSINGRPYYVIDSSGSTLITLSNFAGNPYRQYYLEMRRGILNSEATDAIISALGEVPFAIVNRKDYENYLSGGQEDPFMSRILAFVHENFEPVDGYERPEGFGDAHILSFLVMEKR